MRVAVVGNVTGTLLLFVGTDLIILLFVFIYLFLYIYFFSVRVPYLINLGTTYVSFGAFWHSCCDVCFLISSIYGKAYMESFISEPAVNVHNDTDIILRQFLFVAIGHSCLHGKVASSRQPTDRSYDTGRSEWHTHTHIHTTSPPRPSLSVITLLYLLDVFHSSSSCRFSS